MLMRVPLGVVGQGVGVASFPFLAQLYSEGKFDELNRLLNSTLKGLIATLVPITALIIAQSAPIVYLVFSHTRMRPPDLDATAATLAFFTLGLFGWGAQYILARGFYATRNTLTPAIVGTVLTFANLPLYWLLVRHYRHLGLAMASSVGILVGTVILFLLLARGTHNREEGALVLFFLKVCAASAVAAFACYKLRLLLEPHLDWHTFSGALLMLIVLTVAGIVLLIAFGKILGIHELDEQLARLWLLAPWGSKTSGSKTPA